MRSLFALILAYCLWSCDPAGDMVSPPPDCPDTTWVMTKDTVYPAVSHHPCKRTWNIDIGDWVPSW